MVTDCHAAKGRCGRGQPLSKRLLSAAACTSARLLLLLICYHTLQTPLCAEPRWPRFRGPHGTGHSADDNVPVKWGPDDVAWRTKLDGLGHSSPCVWDEKIFLTSARKTKDKVERSVLCVDRRTGKIVWQKVASVGKPEVSHRMNGYASATCATDGERVVAFFGRGGIHCFDMDGKKLWSRDLGAFPGPWGTAASPIIVGSKVIQNCDAQGESFVTALDRQTGKTLWKTDRGTMPRGGWSTPLVLDAKARKEMILNGEYGVNAYDPDTGKELWFCQGFSGRGTPSPTFGRELLFVISSKPGDTFAVRPGGSGDVTDSRMVWRTPRNAGRNLSSPILVGKYLLTVNMDGTAVCYDAVTGKELWTERLGSSNSASPMAAGGLIYLQNEAGETLVIKPGDKLDIVARNALDPADDEIFRSSLVPSQGQIFCRSSRVLYCIGR